MPNITTKLTDKKEVATGTMAFFFKKPENFSYKAGQFLDWTLPDPPQTDAEGNTRAFSIADGPQENDLMIATRMRDTAFKRVLKDMPIGSTIEISEPMGSFTLHNNSSKAGVFLIGGIGITPVRSILFDAAKRQSPHKLYLFYSSRTPKDAAFLKELDELQKQNPNFKLIATMTDMKDSSWPGEKGYITEEMIKKYIPDISTAVWYISGPQTMVKAMRVVLENLKINEDDIKTEEFSGY